ncbi:MAG: hypothetical protein CVU54_09880 [Deltaproteobacteria bacterium HGW-Deltaproteobacteria-12]|jgi:outer membrane biosynthesis protein TonB|nr:MAG: hypothetical protein CVU54_09880 [Deltaproteobacteria bacterium HGW-Deltaproteobacteria-12]
MKLLGIVFVIGFSLLTLICAPKGQAEDIYTYTDKDGNTVLSNIRDPQKQKAKKNEAGKRGLSSNIQLHQKERKESEKILEAEQRRKQQMIKEQKEAEERSKQKTKQAQQVTEQQPKKQAPQEQAKTGRTGCEIVDFSQYERMIGIGDSIVARTCVDLIIRNNDSVERNLTSTGIVAVLKNDQSQSPEKFTAGIKPGGIYKGTACFGKYLTPIIKIECKF